ncbi:MAG: phosphoglycerate kinase [Rickettsiales bacterium]|jgi:phosphoglycerate kinase|nr:phosphoglycerate kinase [Rickettsiales bacterium]
MELRTLADMGDIAGKRVLVRADLNVPTENGRIIDGTRISRFAPTARALAERGAKVIILTHFGRPKGVSAEFSDAFIAPALAAEIGRPVAFAPDCAGPSAEGAVAEMKDGGVLLLENVRFHPQEEANDPEFARELASLGDLFVNDAFSAAHRAHASTVGITRYLPSYAGLLMQEEAAALSGALDDPARPSAAIVAGSKISTKLLVIENVAAKVDLVIVGGAMANTFLLAQGIKVGASLAEKDMADVARRIMAKHGGKIFLPVDACVAKTLDKDAPWEFKDIFAIADDDKILDIGEKTSAMIRDKLGTAKTVLLNGTLGVYETPQFARGSIEAARDIAALTRSGSIMSVAGGGDTVATLNMAGAASEFTYVSTAGGAFLEWLEGKTLPAIPPLAK